MWYINALLRLTHATINTRAQQVAVPTAPTHPLSGEQASPHVCYTLLYFIVLYVQCIAADYSIRLHKQRLHEFVLQLASVLGQLHAQHKDIKAVCAAAALAQCLVPAASLQ